MDATTGAGRLWAADGMTTDQLLELHRPPAWHADAACKEAPATVTWFPGRTDNIRTAKAVCAGCLVADECRAWADSQDVDLQGVWGGLSDRERRKRHQAKDARGLID